MKRLLALLPVLLLAAPAAAAGATGVSDPCGDTPPMLQAGPVRQDAPAARTAGVDIERIDVQDLLEGPQDEQTSVGVQITMQLCGDVPEEFLGSNWSVRWQLPASFGDCTGSVSLSDGAFRLPDTPARTAVVSKACSTRSTTPTGASSTTSVIYSERVPAASWSVTGDRIVWQLRRGQLGRAEELFTPGTRWGGAAGSTRDGQQITLFDVEGVRASGPGSQDSTGTTAPYTVA